VGLRWRDKTVVDNFEVVRGHVPGCNRHGLDRCLERSPIFKLDGPLNDERHVMDPKNKMFGRSGFLIHGDSFVKPGKASRGCIIMGRLIRNAIAASGDRLLRVVA
jgi:hypothetical protein